VQVEAVFAQINSNESDSVHDDGLQKKSPLSLPLAGIGLTISLIPIIPNGSPAWNRRRVACACVHGTDPFQKPHQ
jgi:hypothetical protein